MEVKDELRCATVSGIYCSLTNAYMDILALGCSTASYTTYQAGELPDQLFRKFVTMWPSFAVCIVMRFI